ncbi:hypothetical protein ACHWQZ_G018009 [Mnemiopsis leidyi]
MDHYKDLTCEICQKVLPNITRLRRHNSAHKQAFKKEFGVTNVARRSLNQPLPSSGKNCKECGRVFRHTMTLKRHERYHEKVRSQTCTECGMIFRSESYLLAHLLSCHRILPSVRNDITIKVDHPSYHDVPSGITEIAEEVKLPKVIPCYLSDFKLDKPSSVLNTPHKTSSRLRRPDQTSSGLVTKHSPGKRQNSPNKAYCNLHSPNKTSPEQ